MCTLPAGFSERRAEASVFQNEAQRTHRFTRMRMGSVMNLLVISRISCGSVALMSTTCVAGGRYLYTS